MPREKTQRRRVQNFASLVEPLSLACGEERTVNASQHEHETELAQQWLEAASAGDFTSAWAASDTLRHAGVDLLEQGAVVSSSWDGSPIDGGNVLIRCRRN